MPVVGLLGIGDVYVEVVDHRGGLPEEIAHGRWRRHLHYLEASHLIAVATIPYPDDLSDLLAGQILTIRHLPDADQLGFREFVVRGPGTRGEVLVGDLQRHDSPSYGAASDGGQSTLP